MKLRAQIVIDVDADDFVEAAKHQVKIEGFLRELEPVKSRDVAAHLGGERVKALGAPAAPLLVEGAREFVEDALRIWRINGDVGKQIAEKVIQHAARTLFEPQPPPLPAAFENYVAGLLIAGPKA